MLGTDFPYTDWYPKGKHVDPDRQRAAHIGRRTARRARGRRRRRGSPPRRCASWSPPRPTGPSARIAPSAMPDWRERQQQLADPDYDARGVVEKVRSRFDNPDERIRPEAVAVAVDRHAADDAIFTTDTGMSTVWLSRFVTMRGTRRLLGSYNLGSMANAMPQALGAQALDRSRQVVAFCGDGGLTMLLGDLLTAVAPRAAGAAGRLQQRPARHGQARAGAGRPARVRHRARRRRHRRDRARVRPARHPRDTDPDALEDGDPHAFAHPGRCCSTSSPTPRRSRCRRRSSPGRPGASRSPSSPRRSRAGAEPLKHLIRPSITTRCR